MEKSLHWYIGSLSILINTYTAALTTEQVAKKVFSPPCQDLRSFYTESTLRKVLCEPKGRVTTEDKSNIPYQIDCNNSEAVCFHESERSLKLHSDEHKRSFRNCDYEKNEIGKHCWEADHNFSWDQKKVFYRRSRLILRRVKETVLYIL